jgi:hypothetical protein
MGEPVRRGVGVRVGPSRASSVGALVAWCLCALLVSAGFIVGWAPVAAAQQGSWSDADTGDPNRTGRFTGRCDWRTDGWS